MTVIGTSNPTPADTSCSRHLAMASGGRAQPADSKITSQNHLTRTPPQPQVPPGGPIMALTNSHTPTPPSETALVLSKNTPSVPNVLIFGETGTGKSSIINMFAPPTHTDDLAVVSNGALGCTFESLPHAVSLNGKEFKLWDTAGLNEGDHGAVPAEKALENLQSLVKQLSEDGISLLVYCIRGSRFRDVWKVNYDLFCGIICQGKVPVVVCVTGLENEDPMESWWTHNEEELVKHGMSFMGHACVAATKGKKMKDGRYMYEDEYEQSRELVKALVEKHCMGSAWKVNKEAWLSNVKKQLPRYGTEKHKDEEGPAGGSMREGGGLDTILRGVLQFAISCLQAADALRKAASERRSRSNGR